MSSLAKMTAMWAVIVFGLAHGTWADTSDTLDPEEHYENKVVGLIQHPTTADGCKVIEVVFESKHGDNTTARRTHRAVVACPQGNVGEFTD